MVNPGGTGSPARVISATPAPFPPRRSRIDALPSSNRYTHFLAAGLRARPLALTFLALTFFGFVPASRSVFFREGGRLVPTAISHSSQRAVHSDSVERGA